MQLIFNKQEIYDDVLLFIVIKRYYKYRINLAYFFLLLFITLQALRFHQLNEFIPFLPEFLVIQFDPMKIPRIFLIAHHQLSLSNKLWRYLMMTECLIDFLLIWQLNYKICHSSVDQTSLTRSNHVKMLNKFASLSNTKQTLDHSMKLPHRYSSKYANIKLPLFWKYCTAFDF